MRHTLLIALALAGCSTQRPPDYASAETTAGMTDAPAQPLTPSSSPPSYELVPAPVFTTPPPPKAEPTDEVAHEWRGDLLRAALVVDSLSVTQKSQIQSLLDRYRAANEPTRFAHAKLLEALADAFESGTLSTDAFAQQVHQVAAAVESVEAANRQLLEDLHAVLTPAQRVAFASAAESRLHASHEDADLGWLVPLDLTIAQKEQIRTSQEALKPATDESARRDAREERERVLEAFKKDAFAMGELAPVKTGGAIEKCVDRVVVLAVAAAPVLTPEQRRAAASTLRSWASKPAS